MEIKTPNPVYIKQCQRSLLLENYVSLARFFPQKWQILLLKLLRSQSTFTKQKLSAISLILFLLPHHP